MSRMRLRGGGRRMLRLRRECYEWCGYIVLHFGERCIGFFLYLAYEHCTSEVFEQDPRACVSVS